MIAAGRMKLRKGEGSVKQGGGPGREGERFATHCWSFKLIWGGYMYRIKDARVRLENWEFPGLSGSNPGSVAKFRGHSVFSCNDTTTGE